MFAYKLEKLLKRKYNKKNKYDDAYLNPIYAVPTNAKAQRWGKLNRKELLCEGIDIQFNFMGLWDTVPALGPDIDNNVDELSFSDNMTLRVTSAFNHVAHAVALNEYRKGFMVRSIHGGAGSNNTSGRVEKGFLGAHSDIGGGYNEGDLSDAALMWMVSEGKSLL